MPFKILSSLSSVSTSVVLTVWSPKTLVLISVLIGTSPVGEVGDDVLGLVGLVGFVGSVGVGLLPMM